RHDRFKVEARDAQGNLLRDPKVGPDGMIREMGGIASVQGVDPGKTSMQFLNLHDFRTIEKPGNYTVRCTFVIQPGGKNLEELDRTTAFTVQTAFRLKVQPRTEENVRRALQEYIRQARQGTGEELARAVAAACSFAGERAVPDLAALAGEGDRERRVAALGG